MSFLVRLRSEAYLASYLHALVAANRELITRFERKIQATLARVWGEQESVAKGG